MRVRIASYNRGNAVKSLIAALKEKGVKALLLKKQKSKFKAKQDDLIINWGNKEPINHNCQVLNKPNLIETTSNKISFFQLMKEKGLENLCVPFTTDKQVAQQWKQQGHTVVSRKYVASYGGKGIVLDLVNAPLYTKYMESRKEFRVHIFDGEVILVQRKHDKAGNNSKIRNLENGFIFRSKQIKVPPSILETCQKVIDATGLNFGAIDILYTSKDKQWVLEVNSAPGLKDDTLEKYTEAILKKVQN